MSDFDLNATLKAAKTPDPPEEYWQDFPRQIVSRLRRTSAPGLIEPRRFPRMAWGLAAAAACLVIGYAVGQWRGRVETASSNGLLQNEKVIRETMALFPNRVRAIVQDERGLSLVLSEKDDVPASPPLWVKICDGKQCSALVTFSGQEVAVAGQRITVLSDARGGVMLVGSRFVWSSGSPSQRIDRYRIEARELDSSRPVNRPIVETGRQSR